MEESLRQAKVMAESWRREADEDKKLLQDLPKAGEERLEEAKAERDTLRVEAEALERQFAMAESRRKIVELEEIDLFGRKQGGNGKCRKRHGRKNCEDRQR